MINWENLYYHLLDTRCSKLGEKHHVEPRHSGGNKKGRTTTLTHRDHTLAHYIRWKWKGELGDFTAYKMMSGQYTNPMLIPETRDDLIKKAKEYASNPEYILRKRNEAINRWRDPVSRDLYMKAKSEYISSLEDRSIMTKHMQTKECRDKSVQGFHKWKNNNPEKWEEASKKSLETRLYNNSKLTKEEKLHRFGKPGDKNGMWKGYITITQGEYEKVYTCKTDLMRDLKVSSDTIEKYKDSGKVLTRGSLKGFVINTSKFK